MVSALVGLDNCKLSIVVWVGIALVVCIARRDIRASIVRLARAAARPTILVPMFGMLLYVGGVVAALWAVRAWTVDTTADTLFWFVGSALVLFVVVAERVRTDPRFFRRTVVRTVSTVAVVGFVVDLLPLSLIA